MTTIRDISIGQKISFELYPASQYGTGFRDVTFVALVDAQLARSFGLDIYAAHQNVYPTLPEGTPIDPTQYSYFIIENNDKQRLVLGEPWMRLDTLTINDGKDLTLVFQNIDDVRKQRIIDAALAVNERPDSVTFV